MIDMSQSTSVTPEELEELRKRYSREGKNTRVLSATARQPKGMVCVYHATKGLFFGSVICLLIGE